MATIYIIILKLFLVETQVNTIIMTFFLMETFGPALLLEYFE